MSAFETFESDTDKSPQHDRDRSWPRQVVVQMEWPNGAVVRRVISADEFFGRGAFGAPLSGDSLIAEIERMRLAGPPAIRKGGTSK